MGAFSAFVRSLNSEIQVEASQQPLHCLEDVQVERDRVGDNFVQELLAKLDLALP